MIEHKTCQVQGALNALLAIFGNSSSNLKGPIFPLLQVEKGEQHLLYDLNDALNGVGGALGLFLGMSLLGLYEVAAGWWNGRKEKEEEEAETVVEEKGGKWAE